MEDTVLAKQTHEMVGQLIAMVGSVVKQGQETKGQLEDLTIIIDGIDKRLELVEQDVKIIKEDVKDIQKNQDRHERILEMLSLKYVETQTDILDLKRRF